MDWTALSVSLVTGIVGIGAVSVFLKQYLPKVSKYAMLAKDATETLSDVVDSLKDGALSVDEIAKVKADVAQFQADLKA